MNSNLLGLTLSALIVAAPFASANITVEVFPSPAPNVFGSPSWADYVNNAQNALQNDLSIVGDRNTDPEAYIAFADGSTIDAGNAMVTSFNSWIGVADPASPFGSELGNRLHFGLHAYGDGTMKFTLADVQYNMSSSDGLLDFSGDLSGTTFNGGTRVGVDWGADNAPGGGDDTIYIGNQDDTTLVDELFYVGVGNAYWPGGGDADRVNPDAGRQGSIDASYEYITTSGPITFGTEYTILGNSGSASVTLVPEPSSLGLLVLGGLIAARRRRA